MRHKFLLSVVLISLFSLVLVSADAEGGCGGYGMMSGTYGFGGIFFGWLFGILVIVALTLLIFWLVKQIQKK